MNAARNSWQAKAKAKRDAEFAKIPSAWRLSQEFLNVGAQSDLNVLGVPRACGILNAKELSITEDYDAISLAKAVQCGSIKAVDVATAFSKRAAIAQQLTSCLTETMFDDAIKRGAWLDQFLAEQKRPVGPLHGVPISVKDSFHYAGVQSTLGFVSFLDHPVEKANAPLLDILLDLGAILYCKTNVPQTLMCGDTENNVFGTTLNPHKLRLGAGGSSGGEGALVVMRGSILGVGTDIAGSVRIPALCCGTYGFRPTTQRIPSDGQAWSSRSGSPGFPSCVGPLANSFDDLEFFLRHVLESKPWDRDFSSLVVPWRFEVTGSPISRKIRIGYYKEDPELPIHPPVLRAMESAARVLGECVKFEVINLRGTPPMKPALEKVWDCFSYDNSQMFRQLIDRGGEPTIASLQRVWHTIDHKPSFYNIDDVFNVNTARSNFKAAWHKIWVENRLDVILTPGSRGTAQPHTYYGEPAYTCLWNFLDYPAVVIPFGRCDRAIDIEDPARADPEKPYSAEDSDGAPMSIQLVARTFQDEELIAIGRLIDQTLTISLQNNEAQS